MITIDIVNIVENNPITRLSDTYNNRLLTRIKEYFTNEEQQLFITSFYCYLNYNSDEFIIDLDNIWRWLDFGQKDKAKRTLEKNLVIDTDYKILLCRSTEQKKEGRGGHNKETILLTLNAFKELCIVAGTEKAKQIRRYFIKLEELLHRTLEEECVEMKQQLENVKIDMENKLKQEGPKQKEQFLLKEMANAGAIVYIIRVKTLENGQYIIKIGESRRGIENRYKEHSKNYPECFLLDCFRVKKSKDFESYLHNHEKIKIAKVRDLQGHETENELFMIGKELSYSILLHIIDTNIKKYNEILEEELIKKTTELDTYKEVLLAQNQQLQNGENNTLNNILQNLVIEMKSLKDENKIILEKLEKMNKPQFIPQPTQKITTITNEINQTLGPRLLQINPETLTIIKTYESVAECIKSYNFRLKRPSIEKAVTQNTIYHDCRWLYADRTEEPEEALKKIEPTKITKTQNNDYIVKLNDTKTEILNIYLDRKTACLQNNYVSTSALDDVVKNGKIRNGNYYVLYNNCEEELEKISKKNI